MKFPWRRSRKNVEALEDEVLAAVDDGEPKDHENVGSESGLELIGVGADELPEQRDDHSDSAPSDDAIRESSPAGNVESQGTLNTTSTTTSPQSSDEPPEPTLNSGSTGDELEPSDQASGLFASDETAAGALTTELGTEYDPIPPLEAPERERSQLRPRSIRKLSRRQQRKLARDKTEPCDAADLFLQDSQGRLDEALMALAECRVGIRVADRSVQRIKDRYEEAESEDATVKSVLGDLAQWGDSQQSVAWEFAQKALEQLQQAEQDLDEARTQLDAIAAYENADAESTFRAYAVRVIGIPALFAYLYSVVLLTFNRFHEFLHLFPPFNLGRGGLLLLVAGPCCGWLLAANWKYTSEVRKAQKVYIERCENADYYRKTAENASKEIHRLRTQFDLIEPFMRVLAKGYRASWTMGGVEEVSISTRLETARIPNLLTVARAVKGDDTSTSELEAIAFNEVVSPGWRSRDMQQILKLYAEKHSLPSSSFELRALDSDLGEYATSAGARFEVAFADEQIQRKLGSLRLKDLVRKLHTTVLRGTSTGVRPPVQRERKNGFEGIDLRNEWLRDDVPGEDWVSFLVEIFGEAPPFRSFGVADSYGPLNDSPVRDGDKAFQEQIFHSTFLYPDYLTEFVVGGTQCRQVAFPQGMSPVDIAVRVDNSPWAAPDNFTIFRNDDPKDLGADLEDEVSGYLRDNMTHEGDDYV